MSKKSNRRKFLQTVGTGVAATSGMGIASTGALGAEDSDPILTELTGDEKNKIQSKAQKSAEFKALKKHVKKQYDIKPSIENASAYKIEENEEVRYGVEFPLSGIENSVQSTIVIAIKDGSVTTALGGTATVDGERVTEYTQFKVDSKGAVTSDSVSLKTDEDRKKLVDEYGSSGFSIASQCSDCRWAVKRICGWGCGISGALFCGAISVAFPIAGIGCAAFFALYCYELDASGACYYRGSAHADCKFMGYC